MGDKGHDAHSIEGHFSSQWPKLKRALDKTIASSPPVNSVITETEPSVEEQLSNEARQLLIEAANDENGMILYVTYSGGTSVLANQIDLISEKSPRCIAGWKAALNELVDFHLIEPNVDGGEAFNVTREGYRIADLIVSRTSVMK